MHDRNGTPLKKGDIVTITAEISDLYATEDYCNVQLKTVHGRRPDNTPETIGAINTGVLVLQSRKEEPAAVAQPA
jgi:hypothetical protein